LSTSLILKLSIVTQGGLSLAELPRTSEGVERQLASGLLSALTSFSREVYKSELESLSFHDRTVTFIPVGEFFIVAEVTSTVDNDLLGKVLSGMKNRATGLLQTKDQTTLSPRQAEEIIDQLGSLDWINSTLESLGYKKPLSDGQVFSFKIDQQGEIETIDDVDMDLFQIIASFIKKGEELSGKPISTIKAFIPISTPTPAAVYMVASRNGEKIDVGLLKTPDHASHTLFRLVPVLDREFDKIKALNHDFTIPLVLEGLKGVHDYTQKKFEKFDENEISLAFMEKNVKKNYDRGIFSVIVGDQVAVVGDKPSVRIVSNSLALFAQHRVTDTIDWLEEDRMGHNITGMSDEKYAILQQNNEIDDSTTVINLDKGSVTGGTSNKFIKKLFERVKKLDPKNARELIYQELDLLVSYALNVTMLTLLSLDEAVSNLESLKQNINNNPKFDLILKLAKQRNPWLELMINEVSASLKTAEDYLADF
jgi:hypothetical protein